MSEVLPAELVDELRKKATPAHLAQYVTKDLPPEAQWRPFDHLLYLNDILVDACTSSEQTFLNVAASVRHGKALALDTPIPTPGGWVPMGDLRPGDEVFDERGRVCRVVEAFDPYVAEQAYEVTFSDHSKIVADGPHRWTTYSYRESQGLGSQRRNRGEPHRQWPETWGLNATVRTTEEIAASGERHYIPTCLPIETPDVDLPLDPYVLGCWLGDGTTANSGLTSADPELVREIESRGVEVRPSKRDPRYFWLVGLNPVLRAMGVLGNKHVPVAYLRASPRQRLDLLRGLMDTDGGFEASLRNTGRVSFTNQNEAIVRATGELLVSLGAKVTYDQRPAVCSGTVTGKTAYRVSSSPPFQPFVLERKAARWSDDSRGSLTRRTRAINSIVPIGRRAVRCIAVDSPSHLYLAGESMIPTHNSELISRYLVVWFLGMFPDRQVIIVSYNETKAAEWGVFTRDLMKEWGPELFGLTVDPDTSSKTDWKIKGRRGGCRAVGVNGSLTGIGGDLIIIDDPIKNREEADSQAARDNQFSWYGSTLRSRLMPGGTLVLTMARWHEDDLTGKIEKQTAASDGKADKWQFIRLPALAEAPKDAGPEWRDPLGRADGEALWPEVWTKEMLEQVRASINPADWESLYQQNPTPREGGMFKVVDWRERSFVDRNTLRMVRCWDLAATDGGGDWTVGALVGMTPDNEVCVLDIQRFRKNSAGVKSSIRSTANLDGKLVPIRVEQERAGAGKSQVQDLVREMVGFNVKGVRPDGTKEQRAAPFAAQQQQNNVYLVGLTEETHRQLIEEFRVFPKGRHDDVVDAVVGAFDELAQSAVVEITRPEEVEGYLTAEQMVTAAFGARPDLTIPVG